MYPCFRRDKSPIEYFGYDVISTIRSDEILLDSPENTYINRHVKSRHIGRPNQFYMVSHHQERMQMAAKAFGWNTHLIKGPKGFDRIIRLLHEHLEKNYNDRFYPAPLMLRLAFSAGRMLRITSDGPHPRPATIDRVPPLPHIEAVSQLYPRSLFHIANSALSDLYLQWQVFITFIPVQPNVFTRHKTSDRLLYEHVMNILPARPTDLTIDGVKLQIEVLIVNERGEIMEGCRTTPYFRRDNKWITPAAYCGGNVGTTRRWALEKELCEEGVVKGGSVKYDEIIVLSNGARGFQAGIVRPWTSLL